YACAAAAERTKAAVPQITNKMIRNPRERCINAPERQHVSRRILIRKRLPLSNVTLIPQSRGEQSPELSRGTSREEQSEIFRCAQHDRNYFCGIRARLISKRIRK